MNPIPFLICGLLSEEATIRYRAVSALLGQRFSKTPTYNSWKSMNARCYDSRTNGFKNYGGRGIVVCDRWRNSYFAFLKDMGIRPNGAVIDRIDPNGNYEPCNCRWSDRVTSIRNKRNVTVNSIPGESRKDRKRRTNLVWERKVQRRRKFQPSEIST